jgi:GDP-mannose 4,6 dehydratase
MGTAPESFLDPRPSPAFFGRICRAEIERIRPWLNLRALRLARDRGWAPEYVEAMHQMLERGTPEDFIIATGETNPLEDFVAMAFSCFGPSGKMRLGAFTNCKGDEDIDAKRSRPSIGKPGMGHAKRERVLLFGTDQRITSGPAAKRLHSKAGLTMMRSPLRPRAAGYRAAI